MPVEDHLSQIRTEADRSQTVELSEEEIERIADLIAAKICSLLKYKVGLDSMAPDYKDCHGS